MLIRVIIAIVAAVIALALLSPVARVIGFPMTSDIRLIAGVCIAGLAALYIIRG